MFSIMPTPPVHRHSQTYHYTTHAPSPLSSSPLRASPDYTPLSPRDTNALPLMSSPTTFKVASPSQSNPTSRTSEFSKRQTKSNPLLHNRGDGRETRRKMFLKKVREDSEDKRWKARGGDEEMMRTIWIAEQRRREERRALDPDADTFIEEDLDDVQSLDEVMADEVARTEDEELEALLSSMEEPPADSDMQLLDINRHEFGGVQKDVQPSETPYGSDDDDYDHIFMDVIQEESRQMSSQQPGDVEMDMS